MDNLQERIGAALKIEFIELWDGDLSSECNRAVMHIPQQLPILEGLQQLIRDMQERIKQLEAKNE